jgi:hypothetical protein
MTEAIRERLYGFEAVKSALRQTKDGISITLVIQPSDIPRDLLNDNIGQRYMVGMGKLNDKEEIEEPESIREGKKMVTSCAAICRDFDFQKWLFDNGFIDQMSEKLAAKAVRKLLQVESRSELKTNGKAQERWGRVRELFIGRLTFEENDID